MSDIRTPSPARPLLRTPRTRRLATAAVAATCLALAAAQSGATATAAARSPFVGPLHTVSTIASTVPANGDVNPYGVAVVPRSVGRLHGGDVLVSNFNAASNLQGTGTTIVQVAPDGAVSQFAAIDPAHLPGKCPGGVGLTTALSVLRNGWVIVGSLPTADGTSATAQSGCLLVLDSRGRVQETITGHGLNGPWDMTALDFGDVTELFVTNVLNGTLAANGATVHHGTVVRLLISSGPDYPPTVLDSRVIASGFGERTDPAALVVGPTGVGLDRQGTLFVADSVGNRVAAIPNAPWRGTDAGAGRTVTADNGLNTPLGLAVAPNGDVLTVNAGDGNLVETTRDGVQVAERTLDANGSPAGAGNLFGLAVAPDRRSLYFVDDSSNTLNRLSAP
ncbi:hypothetical protein [Catenulispora rubra]|uniref:hypothetical protein n=1 Tax=Catenulispora rubra TaxID=280293 RepID=UPI001E614DD8|nr:hypothetical protein [Catenulispora rubra]